MKKYLLLSLSFLLFSTNSNAEESKKITSSKEEAYFLKNIKQLTFEGEKNGEGYFSPDGKKIIFQSVRGTNNKFYQIYSMNEDGSNVKLISTGRGKTTCAYFSPDGKKIIYASSHLDPNSEKEEENKGKGYKWDFEKSLDIFEANLDGSNLKRLTSNDGYDAEGTYSHDGKHIVFTSEKDGDTEIYIMDSDGKNQKRITNYKGYDGGAFFSPDDKKLTYRRFDDRGNAQIVISNTDGTDLKELTATKAINWCPSFSPDGKHIVFSSNMNDKKNFELFIMDIDGNNLRQITFNKGSDVLPVFSPDGKKLLWTSTREDGKSQLLIADFNTEVFNDTKKYSQKIYDDMKFLASDELEGRRTGTKGGDKAGDYISEQFKKSGLKAFKNNSYNQQFKVVTSLSKGKKNSLNINNLDIKESDFTPLNFSESTNAKGELVFAGYGISAKEYNYDDYENLDVKDKIVVLLKGEPQKDNEKSIFNGNKPTQYSDLRYKVFNARNKGAKAVIFVNSFIDKEDDLIELKNNESTSSEIIPVIQVKKEIINNILEKKNFVEIQSNIDKDLKSCSFSLKLKAEITCELIKEYKDANNIIGIIEGSDSKLKDEIIIIGAHYDHLGYGGVESLSELKTPAIHNGADDNASGTVGLIEIANNIAKLNPKRTFVFIAFSGEELGLLGSAYFTNNLPFKNIITMINMDMIGRLTENKISIGGNKTSSNFESIIKNLNKNYNFDISYFDDGYGPSDHMSFYLKNIPVLFFFTGIHEDYHKPTDDFYKINLAGLKKVSDFVQEISLIIDKNELKPDFIKNESKISKNNNANHSSEKGNGAYIGGIPDYTSMNPDKKTGGVKLSGIKEGSPAEKAGLKADDIVIRFDNIEINNIYDYTYAIKNKKPNDKVKIIVKRNNKEIELELIVGKK